MSSTKYVRYIHFVLELLNSEEYENNNLATKTNLRKIYSFPQLYFPSSLLFDKYIESENEMKHSYETYLDT